MRQACRAEVQISSRTSLRLASPRARRANSCFWSSISSALKALLRPAHRRRREARHLHLPGFHLSPRRCHRSCRLSPRQSCDRFQASGLLPAAPPADANGIPRLDSLQFTYPHSEMNDGSKAVFLSYASQDAKPARRIVDALRAAGVEVWFDQNELGARCLQRAVRISHVSSRIPGARPESAGRRFRDKRAPPPRIAG